MYIEIEGLRIGGREQPLIITAYDAPDHSVESSDISITNRPGIYAGRDRKVEKTHVFTIRTGGGVRNYNAALELADELTRVWAKGTNLKPGETMPMIIETTRRRRIFGRPRKLTAITPDVRGKQGSVEFLLEFIQTDPVVYGAEDESFSISVLPEPQGGIKTPLIAPIQTVSWGGTGYRFVSNDGDAPTTMAVRFYGPATKPTLEVNGQEVAINGTIAYDDYYTVDGRTGSVKNRAGANVSRYLTSRTRLDALRLAPGNHEVGFRAEDSTFTARAEILYADAFNNF